MSTPREFAARRVVILLKTESGRTWPAWAIAGPGGVTRFAWLAATKRRGPWRTRPAALPRGVVVLRRAGTRIVESFRAAWAAAAREPSSEHGSSHHSA